MASDSNGLRNWLRTRGIKPVIPSRCNRMNRIWMKSRLYRQRSKVECFFHRLKRWRKIATQLEKRAESYLSIDYLAAT